MAMSFQYVTRSETVPASAGKRGKSRARAKRTQRGTAPLKKLRSPATLTAAPAGLRVCWISVDGQGSARHPPATSL
jgi:hypothetical protein